MRARAPQGTFGSHSGFGWAKMPTVDTNYVKQAAAKAGDHPVLETRRDWGTPSTDSCTCSSPGWHCRLCGGGAARPTSPEPCRPCPVTNIGRVLLWIAVLGFLGWVSAGDGGHRRSRRDLGLLKAEAKAVVYLSNTMSRSSR